MHIPGTVKPSLFGICLLLLGIFIACGSAAPATSAPAATNPPQPVVTAASTPAPVATVAPTAPPAAVEKPRGTLRIALDEVGPPRWLPKLMGAPQSAIGNNTFLENLWIKDPSGVMQGQLLESWEVSPDGKVWTLRLRQGIPFHHDYGELTADDVLWTMANSIEEGTVFGRNTQIREHFFADGGGTTVPDPYTLVVDTVKPRLDFTWYLNNANWDAMGHGIYSKKYSEDLGPEKAPITQAVGTGPWRSEKHDTGGIWRFEAVEDHWRKTPNFAELHYIEIAEESTRLANFLAGKLDTGHFNLESIGVLEKQCQGCKFMEFPAGGQLFINIHGQMYVDRSDLPTPRRSDLPWISSNPDVNSPEWDQARKVRLAMNVAIDRQLLVDTLLGGHGVAVHHYGWAGHEDRLGELADLKYEYNPELARQLLAEAGYPNGIDLTMALTPRPYAGTIETAEAVTVMWEEVGIRTTQTRQPMSSFRAQFPERSWEGVNSHGRAVDIEPFSTFNTWRTDAVINYGMEHPFAEDIISRMEDTLDEEERFALAREFSKFLFENAITIPTVQVAQIWPIGPQIDTWELLCCVVRVPSRTEYVTPRR